MRRALQFIFGISLFGAVFSGTLTYRELFAQTAAVCPAPGAAGTVLGYPACVYGFFMYVIITGIAAAGLLAGRRRAGKDAERSPALGSPRAQA